jgi:hypothetical protein
MAAYQTLAAGGLTFIVRTADKAIIPEDPVNRDYQAYLAWVAEGNTATPGTFPQ